jgi:hypothetical protein
MRSSPRPTAVIDAALDSRRLSLLWQREARHLGTDDYRLVRRRTRWIAEKLDELFLAPRRGDLDDITADIRSWVLVSLVSRHGLYDSPLPRQRLARELIEASRRVVAEPAVEQAGKTSSAQRDQLIYAAAGTACGFRACGGIRSSPPSWHRPPRDARGSRPAELSLRHQLAVLQRRMSRPPMSCCKGCRDQSGGSVSGVDAITVAVQHQETQHQGDAA